MPHDVADTAADRPSVIVTGSGGLLGKGVCARLAGAGYFVLAFDRAGFPEPPKGRFVRDVEFDVTDYANVRRAMDDVRRLRGDRLAAVVHLAAYYDFSGEDSPLYEKVTVEGTDRLLNALQDFAVERFVFSSTMLVHAPCAVGEHITEDSPLEGKWAYPKSKITTEKIILEGHPAVASTVLRMAGVYTDWGTQPTLAQQIKRIWEKDLEGHVFPGDAAAGQSLMHVDDAVDSLVAAVERRDRVPPRTPILVGEADPPGYGELQSRIAELLHGEAWTTVHIPAWFAKAGAWAQEKTVGSFVKPFMVDLAGDHYALDVSRAREMLGWSPKHRLMDVLPTICQNLKDDPAALVRGQRPDASLSRVATRPRSVRVPLVAVCGDQCRRRSGTGLLGSRPVAPGRTWAALRPGCQVTCAGSRRRSRRPWRRSTAARRRRRP